MNIAKIVILWLGIGLMITLYDFKCYKLALGMSFLIGAMVAEMTYNVYNAYFKKELTDGKE